MLFASTLWWILTVWTDFLILQQPLALFTFRNRSSNCQRFQVHWRRPSLRVEIHTHSDWNWYCKMACSFHPWHDSVCCSCLPIFDRRGCHSSICSLHGTAPNVFPVDTIDPGSSEERLEVYGTVTTLSILWDAWNSAVDGKSWLDRSALLKRQYQV